MRLRGSVAFCTRAGRIFKSFPSVWQGQGNQPALSSSRATGPGVVISFQALKHCISFQIYYAGSPRKCIISNLLAASLCLGGIIPMLFVAKRKNQHTRLQDQQKKQSQQLTMALRPLARDPDGVELAFLHYIPTNLAGSLASFHQIYIYSGTFSNTIVCRLLGRPSEQFVRSPQNSNTITLTPTQSNSQETFAKLPGWYLRPPPVVLARFVP